MRPDIFHSFQTEVNTLLQDKCLSPAQMAIALKKEAAFLQNVGNRIAQSGAAAGKAVKKGWEYGSNVPGKGWLGTGAQLAGKSRLGRAWEHASSLGGATKYLPVGTKSLTVGFGAADAYSGLKKQDPAGQGRSRLERLSGTVGGTAAGLAASPLGLKAIPIGMAGGYVASRIGRAISPRKPIPAPVQAPPVTNTEKQVPASPA